MATRTLASERLNELSACDIAHGIAAGRFTAEAVTRACLDRIASREETIHAWAHLDPELALRQARALDRGPVRGPLHGVPVGVKDVLDTFDMPTQMGSPIYDGHQPAADASCVALARIAGAVILGKTITCEFAGVEPNVTANPHDPARTPGGSSSGSAASVADFMVPLAYGTQTGGSVLRPASFCGVVGYKPSFGIVNRAGIKFAAESLDTIGLMARSIDDIDQLAAVLTGRQAAPGAMPGRPPRVGLCRTHLWPTAEPATVNAIEDAAARLASAGADIREVTLPHGFEGLSEARDVLNEYERARAMAHEWRTARERISDRLGASIDRGMTMPWDRYDAARRLAAESRGRLDALFAETDILLAPCVPGEAPHGLHHTGDPKMQGFWTILHVPTMTLPTHRGPAGMPVGIQLVGRPGEDARLMAAARWVWERLRPAD